MEEDGTTDRLRRTYTQLVTTRNAQLQFMASVRRTDREFAFLVSPDLVVQYNYVHRLIKDLRPRSDSTVDICTEDGGIACCNFSVLKERGKNTSPDDSRSHDYLASRIVDLLERPVTIGDDRDSTMDLRDDLATSIRVLNTLFEERLRICRERGDRLQEELSTVKQQLEISRATIDATNSTTNDGRVQSMRERVARYETQLYVVRQQLESLQDKSEDVVRHNRRAAEDLVRRANLHHGQKQYFGEALERLLHKLFERLESERDQILRALEMTRVVVGEPVEETTQTRVQSGDVELAATHELEARVEREVASRTKAVEDTLRTRLQEELDKETTRLRHQFRREVDTKVAEKFAAIPELDVSDIAGLRRLATADLREFKNTLEGILLLKESTLDVVPPSLQAGGPQNREVVYECLGYLLTKMRDMYKFLTIQSEYIKSIGVTAQREYVPLEFMTRERTKKFVNKIDQIMRKQSVEAKSQKNNVLSVLNYILEELPRVKKGHVQRERQH